MKLILQAIKSLLNKLHIRLEALEDKTSDENIADGKFLPEGTPVAVPKPYSFSERLTANYGGVFYSSSKLSLTVGNTYIVCYNGIEYTCKCKRLHYAGDFGCYLGNARAITDEEDTGEPFAVFVLEVPTLYTHMVYTVESVGAVELSITGETEYVRKIGGQSLPIEAFPLVIDASIDGSDVVIESGHTREDVRFATEYEKRDVIIRAKIGTDFSHIFRLAYITSGACEFACTYVDGVYVHTHSISWGAAGLSYSTKNT